MADVLIDAANAAVRTAAALKGNATALQLGRLVKSVPGGSNVTLSSSEMENPILEFTGALTANISVIVPLGSGGLYIVYNNTSGAFTLTVKGATGTGVAVGQGKRAILYADGTNVVRVTADA
jgi:hypothetical protein